MLDFVCKKEGKSENMHLLICAKRNTSMKQMLILVKVSLVGIKLKDLRCEIILAYIKLLYSINFGIVDVSHIQK